MNRSMNYRRSSLQALAGGLCLVFSGYAVQAETIAIVGGDVHTMGPRGKIENATVLIEDGRIRSVGVDVDIPTDAKRVDASGRVVTPGLFDPYSGLGLVEVSLSEGTVDHGQTGDRFTVGFDVSLALNPRSTLLPITRVEGITRAFVAPAPGQDAVSVINGLGALVQLGDSSDFVVQSQAGLCVTLGEYGAGIGGGSRVGATLQLRELLQDASDYAEHRPAFERGSRRAYAAGRLDLEATSGFLGASMPLMVRAERASDLSSAIELAQEFDLQLVLVGAAEAWMVAKEIAAADASVILNPIVNLPDRFESLGARADNAALLHKAGVQFAFANFDTHNARNIKQVAGNAVAAGLSWDAALEAITIAPARIFGQDRDYGRLAPGYSADVVIWSGDPLEVTTFADVVFIEGERIDMTTRQTLLRDRYMKLDGDWPPAYQ